MNAFQHHAYLEKEVADCSYEIEAIGDTIIAPLGIYNNKSKIIKLEDIKDGDIIAIPSDATNGGRALKILEEIGLIEVDPAVGYLPTVADITKYNVKIEIKEAESATLASILPDVTAALINGGNAYSAGLSSAEDTIYLEDVNKVTDIDRLKNLIAVQSDELDNEVYQKNCRSLPNS
jgi:D-methionine transport system substrate-binding protein